MEDRPMFTIRVVAQLTGAHPQTIRMYETKGLVEPARTAGGTRMYSRTDVELLEEIIELSQAGVTHEGIARIIRLEHELAEAEEKVDRLLRQNAQLKAELSRARNQPTAIVVYSKPLLPVLADHDPQ